jgi:cellulose synthase/poly-beta-1,6-N-acetylglucosamine synthase-like glycosyltransferase
METISLIVLIVLAIAFSYPLLLALASVKKTKFIVDPSRESSTKFAIVIPAHNEATVIKATVERLRSLHYPSHLFQVHVVADYCDDSTAQDAREAGAVVHERNEGPRTGKGIALTWLFERVFAENWCDAIVVFDADTRVDAEFLKIMDARIAKGDLAIQGQHIISNFNAGWFPALTWAMFLIDNRFQNMGRSNLGWSAKHMGDSICFRADVLKKSGWGEGLTEDYQLRQRLLLAGIRIVYEPSAKGYGEAALTLKQAQAQRARWLRGAKDANQQLKNELFTQALKRRDGALFDGWLQAFIPSYSTLTLVSVVLFAAQLLINWFIHPFFGSFLLTVWAVLVALLTFYPFFGLVLERVPLKAYIAVMMGPFFILWRTWLALTVRLRKKPVVWVRTDHSGTS